MSAQVYVNYRTAPSRFGGWLGTRGGGSKHPAARQATPNYITQSLAPNDPHHIAVLQKTAAAQHKTRAIRQPLLHHHAVAKPFAERQNLPMHAVVRIHQHHKILPVLAHQR